MSSALRTPPGLADTNQHYDLDPEIFGLFLGPRRKYSPGLYEDPSDTLEQAETRKLHFVARRLGLRGGERLLDIGCGWGSLVLFMAAEYGCDVVGISPSERQRDVIADRARELGLADRVRVELGQFERLDLDDAAFDAATMLGSVVHLPDLAGAYRRAHRLLRRNGSLYVSESCFRNEAARQRFGEQEGTRYVRDAVFGWGDLRPLSELVRAAEDAGFSVTAVDDLTAHYHRTIEDWLANIRARADRIDAVQRGMADHLARYLEIANAGWGYTTKHYAVTCRRAR